MAEEKAKIEQEVRVLESELWRLGQQMELNRRQQEKILQERAQKVNRLIEIEEKSKPINVQKESTTTKTEG